MAHEDEQIEAQEPPYIAVAPTVTVGGLSVELCEGPALLAVAISRTQEQIEASGRELTLAYGAAALYMTWPESTTWPARARPRRWRPGVNTALYGYDIYEALRKATQGTTLPRDLNVACFDAHNWVVASSMTGAEVAEARRFFADHSED